MTEKFKITGIFSITKRGKWVAAKLLEKGKNMFIDEHCLLGGVSITNNWDIPRKINEDGTPDFDTFFFQLKNEEDAEKLELDSIVELYDSDERQERILRMNDSAIKDIEVAAKKYPKDVGVLYKSYKKMEKQNFFSPEYLRGYLSVIFDMLYIKKLK